MSRTKRVREMATCPRCHDDGRPQEIAVAMTRWTSTGAQTTLRCPVCGWQETIRADQAA